MSNNVKHIEWLKHICTYYVIFTLIIIRNIYNYGIGDKKNDCLNKKNIIIYWENNKQGYIINNVASA